MNTVKEVELPKHGELPLNVRHHREGALLLIKRWIRQQRSPPVRIACANLLVWPAILSRTAHVADSFQTSLPCLTLLGDVQEGSLKRTWFLQPWPIANNGNKESKISFPTVFHTHIRHMLELFGHRLHEEVENISILCRVVTLRNGTEKKSVGIAVAHKIGQHFQILPFWSMFQTGFRAASQRAMNIQDQEGQLLPRSPLVSVEQQWKRFPQIDLTVSLPFKDWMVRMLESKVLPPALPNVTFSLLMGSKQAAENVKAIVLQEKHHPVSYTKERDLQSIIFGFQKSFPNWQCQPVFLAQQPMAISFAIIGFPFGKLKQTFWLWSCCRLPKIRNNVPGRANHSSARGLSEREQCILRRLDLGLGVVYINL